MTMFWSDGAQASVCRSTDYWKISNRPCSALTRDATRRQDHRFLAQGVIERSRDGQSEKYDFGRGPVRPGVARLAIFHRGAADGKTAADRAGAGGEARTDDTGADTQHGTGTAARSRG